MSERQIAMTWAERCEDFYGVDGDGLGEGEVICQEDLEYELFDWSEVGEEAFTPCARASL